MFAFPAFLLLALVFLGLCIALLRQIFLYFKDNRGDNHRLVMTGLLGTVIGLVFFFPNGIIQFDRLSGKDVLVAQREGAANCMTTFQLKNNHSFSERSVCFGVFEIQGDYKIVGDTIFFENVEVGRSGGEYYQYAVIRPSTEEDQFDLVKFKSRHDTIGLALPIIKNELNKPEKKTGMANIRF